MSLSCLLFSPIMLLSNSQDIYAEESAHYACIFFPQQNATVFSSVSTVPQLLHFTQGGLAMILRFHAKSEGLGDFNLLNNKSS